MSESWKVLALIQRQSGSLTEGWLSVNIHSALSCLMACIGRRNSRLT